MTGIMCLPRYSLFLLPLYSRQRWRFSSTSRIPTVIWVGRSSSIATGLRMGSRTVTMAASVVGSIQNLSAVVARGDAAEHDAELIGLHQFGVELADIPRLDLIDPRHAVRMFVGGEKMRQRGRAIRRIRLVAE